MTDANGWSTDDYAALNDATSRMPLARGGSVPPDWLAAIMLSESHLNPGAVNSIGCVGLIQFCSPPVANMASMTPAQQMPFVERYFAGWIPPGGWVSRAQLYEAGYVPAFIAKKGSDPSTVLTQRGDGLYDGNEDLDPTGKGFITVGDLDTHLDQVIAANPARWNTALAGIVAAGGTLSGSTSPVLTHAATVVAGGLALGMLGFYLYLNRDLLPLPRLARVRRYA